jgi:hypothetical protein
MIPFAELKRLEDLNLALVDAINITKRIQKVQSFIDSIG